MPSHPVGSKTARSPPRSSTTATTDLPTTAALPVWTPNAVAAFVAKRQAMDPEVWKALFRAAKESGTAEACFEAVSLLMDNKRREAASKANQVNVVPPSGNQRQALASGFGADLNPRKRLRIDRTGENDITSDSVSSDSITDSSCIRTSKNLRSQATTKHSDSNHNPHSPRSVPTSRRPMKSSESIAGLGSNSAPASGGAHGPSPEILTVSSTSSDSTEEDSWKTEKAVSGGSPSHLRRSQAQAPSCFLARVDASNTDFDVSGSHGPEEKPSHGIMLRSESSFSSLSSKGLRSSLPSSSSTTDFSQLTTTCSTTSSSNNLKGHGHCWREGKKNGVAFDSTMRSSSSWTPLDFTGKDSGLAYTVPSSIASLFALSFLWRMLRFVAWAVEYFATNPQQGSNQTASATAAQVIAGKTAGSLNTLLADFVELPVSGNDYCRMELFLRIFRATVVHNTPSPLMGFNECPLPADWRPLKVVDIGHAAAFRKGMQRLAEFVWEHRHACVNPGEDCVAGPGVIEATRLSDNHPLLKHESVGWILKLQQFTVKLLNKDPATQADAEMEWKDAVMKVASVHSKFLALQESRVAKLAISLRSSMANLAGDIFGKPGASPDELHVEFTILLDGGGIIDEPLVSSLKRHQLADCLANLIQITPLRSNSIPMSTWDTCRTVATQGMAEWKQRLEREAQEKEAEKKTLRNRLAKTCEAVDYILNSAATMKAMRLQHNPFAILGLLPRNATVAQVRKVRQRVSLLIHPDKVPADLVCQELRDRASEAFRMLSECHDKCIEAIQSGTAVFFPAIWGKPPWTNPADAGIPNGLSGTEAAPSTSRGDGGSPVRAKEDPRSTETVSSQPSGQTGRPSPTAEQRKRTGEPASQDASPPRGTGSPNRQETPSIRKTSQTNSVIREIFRGRLAARIAEETVKNPTSSRRLCPWSFDRAELNQRLELEMCLVLRHSSPFNWPQAVARIFVGYPWPGNPRFETKLDDELKNHSHSRLVQRTAVILTLEPESSGKPVNFTIKAAPLCPFKFSPSSKRRYRWLTYLFGAQLIQGGAAVTQIRWSTQSLCIPSCRKSLNRISIASCRDILIHAADSMNRYPSVRGLLSQAIFNSHNLSAKADMVDVIRRFVYSIEEDDNDETSPYAQSAGRSSRSGSPGSSPQSTGGTPDRQKSSKRPRESASNPNARANLHRRSDRQSAY